MFDFHIERSLDLIRYIRTNKTRNLTYQNQTSRASEGQLPLISVSARVEYFLFIYLSIFI